MAASTLIRRSASAIACRAPRSSRSAPRSPMAASPIRFRSAMTGCAPRSAPIAPLMRSAAPIRISTPPAAPMRSPRTLSYALIRQREESISLWANFTHKWLNDKIADTSTANRNIALGTLGVTRDTAQDFFGLPLATSSTLSFTSGYVNYLDVTQKIQNRAGVDTVGNYLSHQSVRSMRLSRWMRNSRCRPICARKRRCSAISTPASNSVSAASGACVPSTKDWPATAAIS